MTRIAIDAASAVRLLREGRAVPEAHALVAPSVLRSHALELVYRDVRSGRLDGDEGRRLVEGLARLKIRLLGDRVSRAVAWRVAVELDTDDIAAAEYVAVAQLQADVLVTDDERLRSMAEGRVRLERFSTFL